MTARITKTIASLGALAFALAIASAAPASAAYTSTSSGGSMPTANSNNPLAPQSGDIASVASSGAPVSTQICTEPVFNRMGQLNTNLVNICK